MALTLYSNPRSRSNIVRWYLEERGLDYDQKLIDLAAGEHLQPAYQQIHPFRKLPALADEGFIVWESGAILLYLAEKTGEITAPQPRAIAAQWILFANSTLGNSLFLAHLREKEMPRLLGDLHIWLSHRPFVMGEEFGVADVAVGAMLAYGPLMAGIQYDAYPAVQAYVQKLTERPAYQNTIGSR
ncbi:MAG: glutathione S-transferase family protein [Pseudanabaenaceae cyanobacterium]